MPSFADLKSKASSVASSGVEKVQGLKDRNTSVPMKKTNWDPYSGQPAPPPPPPRSLVNERTKPEKPTFLPPPTRGVSGAGSSSASSSSSSPSVLARTSPASPGPAPPLPSRGASGTPPALPRRSSPMNVTPPPPSRTGVSVTRTATVAKPAGPPPVVRSTRPDMAALEPSSTHTPSDSGAIDWTNLSQEDKDIFFAWLDEFFSKHLNTTVGPPRAASVSRTVGSKLGARGISNAYGAPPPLKVSSKPASWGPQTNSDGSLNSTGFTTSYPPAVNGDSAAADLGVFFSPSTHWEGAWYNTGNGTPPPLAGNTGIRTVSSWQSRGSSKTTRIGVLFSDLSVFWGSVAFSLTNPENQRDITREACYLPRPEALGRAALLEAHEIYGETIALFAENFVGTGEYCARGECWDLANEALKYFAQYDYIPKPVPSISRTHGHLIFEGKIDKSFKGGVKGGGGAVGRWRGGDDIVRRGDIVEWRKVRMAAASGGGYSMLGDPDHTAVIVSDSKRITPSVCASTATVSGCGDDGNASLGFSISPRELGVLSVVEQSVGQPPVRRDYNLQGFEEGEMWIYRPIGLQVYLGIADMTPTPPDSHHRMRRV